jgi:formate dehydrogenase major subunit
MRAPGWRRSSISWCRTSSSPRRRCAGRRGAAGLRAFAEKTGSFTNTDRTVQIGRAAISPPGEARQDLWIVQEMARRLGLDWNYAGPQEVFEEMRRAMPSIAGISWERLEREDAVTYPCERGGSRGSPW